MTIRPWLLAVAFVVGLAAIPVALYARGTPPAPSSTLRSSNSPAARAATPTPSPTTTWRPAVRVDWKRQPPRAQERIDALGRKGDCDALEDARDAALRKDRALAAYVDAWRGHARMCIDAYFNPSATAPARKER